MSINDLTIGESAKVVSLDSLPSNTRQKLLDMGLLEGVVIKLIHKAPLGDPIWVEVMDYELALRRNLAALINVEKLTKKVANKA